MKSFNFIKKCRDNFTTKIFLVIALLIIIISVSFTAFFVRQQSNFRKDSLVKQGQMLARMLAYNGRLGVFAENEELLRDPIEGVMQNRDVQRVRVVNFDGNLLGGKIKPGSEAVWNEESRGINSVQQVVEFLRKAKEQVYFESRDSLEFWSPVLSTSEYLSDEMLLLTDTPQEKEFRVIGFVNVSLDRKMLDRALSSLLLKSCLIAGFCLIAGLLAAYWVVRMVSRPLHRLTERVDAMGTDATVKNLPVETSDEIGKLATAFNKMAASLRKKEAEKEQLEERIRHAQKMEAVGTLAGGVAHDFNNLLTAVIGYGILLQNSLTRKSTLSNYIEQILAAAEKAANLTQRLLTFSRKQVINPKPLNLNQAVLNVQDILIRLVGENIDLKVDLSKEEIVVKADETQMDQVIINLVTNARDAIENGGMITISSRIIEVAEDGSREASKLKSGIYAALTVTDTGAGIGPDTRKRIFDPFFTTKEVGKGTGLGLSIVYGIIEQHKGYIDVEEQPGCGTSFTVMLPLFESTVETRKLETLLLPTGKKETVLLAEDDRLVRNLARHILSKYGYSVIEATDGEEAVTKFIENIEKIDILLLDVIMPKKNGREVYDEIAGIRPGIKTLFMSGYPFDVMSSQGIIEKGIPCISKPLLPGTLLTKMREVLDS